MGGRSQTTCEELDLQTKNPKTNADSVSLLKMHSSARKTSTRKSCKIVSIAESPPTNHHLRLPENICFNTVSPEHGSEIPLNSMKISLGAGKSFSCPLIENEDTESLSDFAFMMELDDACTNKSLS